MKVSDHIQLTKALDKVVGKGFRVTYQGQFNGSGCYMVQHSVVLPTFFQIIVNCYGTSFYINRPAMWEDENFPALKNVYFFFRDHNVGQVLTPTHL